MLGRLPSAVASARRNVSAAVVIVLRGHALVLVAYVAGRAAFDARPINALMAWRAVAFYAALGDRRRVGRVGADFVKACYVIDIFRFERPGHDCLLWGNAVAILVAAGLRALISHVGCVARPKNVTLNAPDAGLRRALWLALGKRAIRAVVCLHAPLAVNASRDTVVSRAAFTGNAIWRQKKCTARHERHAGIVA